jgi:hypothetical protein
MRELGDKQAEDPFPSHFSYGAVLHGIAAHVLIALAPLFAIIGIRQFVTGTSAIPSGIAWWLAAISTWVAAWLPAWRIEVRDRTMHWRCPYGRSGSASVDDVVAIRPGGLLGQLQRIELADGSTIRVLAHQGVESFSDALAFAAGQTFPVSIGWQGRMNQRASWRSWYRALD